MKNLEKLEAVLAGLHGPVDKKYLNTVLRYGRKQDIYFPENEDDDSGVRLDDFNTEGIATLVNIKAELIAVLKALETNPCRHHAIQEVCDTCDALTALDAAIAKEIK